MYISFRKPKTLKVYWNLYDSLSQMYISNDSQPNVYKLGLREGQDTPIGSTIYRAKAFDADGDPLTFGVIYPGQNRR